MVNASVSACEHVSSVRERHLAGIRANIVPTSVIGMTPEKHISNWTLPLAGLRALTRLDLNECRLKSIEAGAFSALESLEHLDLSCNELEIRSDDVFAGLGSLVSLLLKDNQIRGVGSPFAALRNLRELQLDENFVARLSREFFEGMESLECLTLTDNDVRAWTSPVLGAAGKLNSLRLGRNKLMQVTEAMLADFASLGRLDLSENPFVCDCGLYSFYRWASERPEKLERWHEEGAYTCWTKNDTIYSLPLDADEIFRDCGPKSVTPEDADSRLSAMGLTGGICVLVVVLVVSGYFAYRRWWCRLVAPPSRG
ncbi:unnamed protein product [Darwinula stevensoni]|uniref:Uncharacterized protein n=1 Tax=Darwinula stevensoni TaxID=69355 RepID=A0A7R9AED8_9CRUS|nr:unnamed protein product [Darwinula stevensoni]CAG0901931.1 unnamed protein product [Darwinula stevensoni]